MKYPTHDRNASVHDIDCVFLSDFLHYSVFKTSVTRRFSLPPSFFIVHPPYECNFIIVPYKAFEGKGCKCNCYHFSAYFSALILKIKPIKHCTYTFFCSSVKINEPSMRILVRDPCKTKGNFNVKVRKYI